MEKMETIDRSVFDWEKIYFLKHLRTAFFSRITTETGRKRFEKDFERISIAFDMAAECHKHETRDSWGEPYIVHPIAVAEILLKEFKDTNANEIIIALLHDVLETDPTYEQIIKEEFWVSICNHVIALTKEKVAAYLKPHEIIQYRVWKFIDQIISRSFIASIPIIKDNNIPFLWNKVLKDLEKELKQRRNKAYFTRVKKLKRTRLRIKIADRIDSLRTLGGCKPEKQTRITEDTHQYFLNKKVEEKCPNEHNKLAITLVNLSQANTKKRIKEAFPELQ